MLVSSRSRTVRAGLLGTAVIALLPLVVMACAGPGAPLPDGTDLRVTVTSPSGTAYIADSITIQVDVEGAPDQVRLLRDGEAFVTLSPPYTYVWDTTAEPEGSYALQASARRGEVTVESEARTVIVDRTRPTVVDRRPRPGDANVWYEAPITVTFSEALLPSTVSSGTVVLEAVGGAELAVSLDLDAAGVVLTITPEASVTGPVQLRLGLSDAITDLAGNALIAPAAWTWSLPVWQLMGGESLNVDPMISTQSASMALTSAGDPVVLWLEDLPDSKPPTDLYVKRWDGSAWELLGGSLDEGSLGPMYGYHQLTLAPDDTPVVGWVRATAVTDVGVVVQRWDGSAWLPFGDVPFTAAGGPPRWASVATGADGAPLLAWSEFKDGLSRVYVARWTGAAWSYLAGPRARVPGQDAWSPHLVVDGDGRPLVVWMEEVEPPGSDTDVFVDRWNGTTWEPLGGGLRGSAERASFPRLAITPGGLVFLSFVRVAPTGTVLNVVQWLDGTGTWVGRGSLRTSSDATVRLGTVTSDAADRAVALWQESVEDDGETAYRYHVQRREATGWTALGTPLVASGASYPSGLAVAPDGRPIVAVQQPADVGGGQRLHLHVYRLNTEP